MPIKARGAARRKTPERPRDMQVFVRNTTGAPAPATCTGDAGEHEACQAHGRCSGCVRREEAAARCVAEIDAFLERTRRKAGAR